MYIILLFSCKSVRMEKWMLNSNIYAKCDAFISKRFSIQWWFWSNICQTMLACKFVWHFQVRHSIHWCVEQTNSVIIMLWTLHESLCARAKIIVQLVEAHYMLEMCDEYSLTSSDMWYCLLSKIICIAIGSTCVMFVPNRNRAHLLNGKREPRELSALNSK